MQFDSIFGYFGINRNYFHNEGHEGHEGHTKNQYIIQSYPSCFSNFMVKEQTSFVLN